MNINASRIAVNRALPFHLPFDAILTDCAETQHLLSLASAQGARERERAREYVYRIRVNRREGIPRLANTSLIARIEQGMNYASGWLRFRSQRQLAGNYFHCFDEIEGESIDLRFIYIYI